MTILILSYDKGGKYKLVGSLMRSATKKYCCGLKIRSLLLKDALR